MSNPRQHGFALTAFLLAATALSSAGCEPQAVNGYFTMLPQGKDATANGDGPDVFAGAPTMPPPTGDSVSDGVLNGHFDVETSTSKSASGPYVSPAAGSVGNGGKVTYHIHEYDKINCTTTVDFFNILHHSSNFKNCHGDTFGDSNPNISTGSAPNDLNDAIKDFGANQRFRLIIVNNLINRGGIFSINGAAPVRSFQYIANVQNTVVGTFEPGGQLPVYTIGTPAAGETQLTSFTLAFDPTVQARRLLVPTSPTKCVIPNVFGPHNEFRDGALVVQAVDADHFTIDPTTKAAAKDNGGLLWEGIVFNHYMGDNSEKGSNQCFADLMGLLL